MTIKKPKPITGGLFGAMKNLTDNIRNDTSDEELSVSTGQEKASKEMSPDTSLWKVRRTSKREQESKKS